MFLSFLQASLVAVCVPDPEVLPSYAKSNFNITGSMEELVKNPVCISSNIRY